MTGCFVMIYWKIQLIKFDATNRKTRVAMPVRYDISAPSGSHQAGKQTEIGYRVIAPPEMPGKPDPRLYDNLCLPGR